MDGVIKKEKDKKSNTKDRSPSRSPPKRLSPELTRTPYHIDDLSKFINSPVNKQPS